MRKRSIVILCALVTLAALPTVAQQSAVSAGEVTPTLRVPFFPVTLALGLSCLLQCLVMVADIVKIFRNEYE